MREKNIEKTDFFKEIEQKRSEIFAKLGLYQSFQAPPGFNIIKFSGAYLST